MGVVNVSQPEQYRRHADIFRAPQCGRDLSAAQEVQLLPSGDATSIRSNVALVRTSPLVALGSFQDPRGAYCR